MATRPTGAASTRSANVSIESTGRHEGGILTREYDPNRNVSALTVAATASGAGGFHRT